MKTITITEAKRRLGEYLKRAAAGEDIGIVSGADIISLRKMEVVSVDRISNSRLKEGVGTRDWPEFPTFDGGPVDGARNHDKHLYDKPHEARAQRKRRA